MSKVQCWRLDPRPGTTGVEMLHWDGRLDNRREVEARLQRGPSVDSSDASTMRAVYERWGSDGFVHAIGDWSVVIGEPATGALTLASDYAGVRPLYYFHGAGTILCSSQLAALVEATGIHAIDEQYVAGFLSYGAYPNATPYAGIHSVPPGHAVRISMEGTRTQRFWTPPTGVVQYKTERSYDEQLRTLFREAVIVRVPSHASVLAELSGGLDSSSVVCEVARLIGDGVGPRRFGTVSYVHGDSVDLPFIREVETHCGFEGVHLSTDEHPLMSSTEVGTGAPEAWVPVHKSVARLARRLGATVLLTGLNGDLATGNWFDDSLQVSGALRRGRLSQAWREALAWSKVLKVPIAWILGRALRATFPCPAISRHVYSLGEYVAAESTETSLQPAFCRRVGVNAADLPVSNDWLEAPPERRKHFRALTIMRELRMLQRPESLRNVDYTHPFAHRPLLEFLMRVPAHVLCRPGEPRRLMRRALGDQWPSKLGRRRSKGLFGSAWVEALRPLALWLRTQSQFEVVERGWIDRASLVSRLARLTQGIDCNIAQLRQIVLLECWLRHHNGSPGGVTVA
jgi:asparagine synthase (glutamine-hydrolysing)